MTGFTSRLVPALAFLREAWAVADNDNRRSVEAAIRALLKGHSAHEKRELVIHVLEHGLGDEAANEILTAVGA